MKPMFRSISAALVVIVALGAVAAASASAHEWLKNGEPLTKTEAISLTGGEFTIYWGYPEHSSEVVCKKMGGTGELSPGADGVVSPHLSECIAGPSVDKCMAHSPGEPSGTITMLKDSTELVIAQTSKGAKVLADQLKNSTLTKDVAELEFKAETGGSCSGYGSLVRLKGYTFGEVSGEQIDFPNPEFYGDTLEFAGTIAGFEGKYTQKLTGGGKLSAI